MKALIKIIFLIFPFSFIACKDDSISNNQSENLFVCGIKDPLDNVKWLKNEFEKLEGGPEVNGIVLYKYEGKEVIEVQGSLFSSTNQHQYYCNGDRLDLNDPDVFDQYTKKRTLVGVLYGTKLWQ